MSLEINNEMSIENLNNEILSAKIKIAQKIASDVDSAIGISAQDLAIYTAVLERLELDKKDKMAEFYLKKMSDMLNEE